MRLFRLVVIAVIAALFAGPLAVALAERVELDRPIRVMTVARDGTRIDGMVSAYDETGFDIVLPRQQQAQTVPWDALAANNVFAVYDRLMRDAPAQAWIDLGARLLVRPDGAQAAEKAFTRALAIDPGAQPQVAVARAQAADARASAAEAGRAGDSAAAAAVPSGEPGAGPGPGRGDGGPTGTPDTIGAVEVEAWGELTEAEYNQAMAELREFAERTRRQVNDKLQAVETQYFLFYHDLRPNEARKYVALLDQMYARLSQLFNVTPGTNVFRGKALVFVFHHEQDYLNFQRMMHGTDGTGTNGMCHQFGNGRVHIAFHRQPNELDFTNLLVHESVHGFLHRYRKPPRIVSWINEGLAEVVAAELAPDRGEYQLTHQRAREMLRNRGLGNFFIARQIDGWQYPIAQTLSEFMINQNPRAFAAFIDGIKDGLNWQESLQQNYGATPEQLVMAYAQWMRVELPR